MTFKSLRIALLPRRFRYLFRSRFKCRDHGTIYQRSCADCRRARWRRRSRERCNIHRLRWEPSCKHCRRALTNRRVRLGRKITRGVALQFGKEIFKGVGHGIAAVILIAWLLANNAEFLHWQILVAAIAAAILFDPVVTGIRLVKKLVRTVLYSTDDTDSLWEADWQTSRERRQRKTQYLQQRRWRGAAIGAVLGMGLLVALFAVAISPAELTANELFARIEGLYDNQPLITAFAIVSFVVAILLLPVMGVIVGHGIEKALWPKPDENPMRRDDW